MLRSFFAIDFAIDFCGPLCGPLPCRSLPCAELVPCKLTQKRDLVLALPNDLLSLFGALPLSHRISLFGLTHSERSYRF